jgi:hypothetical protein
MTFIFIHMTCRMKVKTCFSKQKQTAARTLSKQKTNGTAAGRHVCYFNKKGAASSTGSTHRCTPVELYLVQPYGPYHKKIVRSATSWSAVSSHCLPLLLINGRRRLSSSSCSDARALQP